MIRSAIFATLVLSFIFAMPEAIHAQRGGRSQSEVIEVRLASPMPRNSDWGRALDRLASEWARVTNNEVRLRILHDGVEGSEAKVFSSLASGNIQAALFTTFGMSEITPAIMTLSIPFFIRGDEELALVLEGVRPLLDEQASRTNFAIVAWSRGGWVNIFSRDEVRVPDDLRRQRMASGPEAQELNAAFRTMGFEVEEADLVDLGPRIANNRVSAMYQSPAATAPLQLHRHLRHMLDLPIAPFLGAVVMNRGIWNRLGPDRQRAIQNVTQRIVDEFDSSMPRTVENAMVSMRRDGLRVHQITSAQEDLWQAEVDRAMPLLLDTTFDRAMYQRINEILARVRGQ